MKDTLQFLVTQIVSYPDEVAIGEELSGDRTTLTIRVNPEDIGKVIGKHGRIIRSLRDLMKLVAAKHNAFVDVMLVE